MLGGLKRRKNCLGWAVFKGGRGGGKGKGGRGEIPIGWAVFKGMLFSGEYWPFCFSAHTNNVPPKFFVEGLILFSKISERPSTKLVETTI